MSTPGAAAPRGAATGGAEHDQGQGRGGSRPTASRNRVARGGTQGGLNCLTHALPRCLPTPTEEADGNGYGVIAGRRGPSRPPPRASVNLVPLLLTGVRLHPPGRTDKHLCRCFGAPATHARRPHGRVFPDHLITWRVGAWVKTALARNKLLTHKFSHFWQKSLGRGPSLCRCVEHAPL